MPQLTVPVRSHLSAQVAGQVVETISSRERALEVRATPEQNAARLAAKRRNGTGVRSLRRLLPREGRY